MALSAAQQALINSRGGAKGNLLQEGMKISKVNQVTGKTSKVSAGQYSAAANNAGEKARRRANS